MKKKTNNMNFRNIRELAYFTAETVIHKEFKAHKAFPKDWDYVITEAEVKHIPQEALRDEVMGDIEHFNFVVVEMIHRRLDWFLAEGFTTDEGDKYRFLSDQEMKAEVDKILAE
jgi:hypothetical protein